MVNKSLLGLGMIFVLLAVLTSWKLSVDSTCILLADACFLVAGRSHRLPVGLRTEVLHSDRERDGVSSLNDRSLYYVSLANLCAMLALRTKSSRTVPFMKCG